MAGRQPDQGAEPPPPYPPPPPPPPPPQPAQRGQPAALQQGSDRDRKHHWRRATVTGVILLVVVVAALAAAMGPPVSSYQLGLVTGRMFVPIAIGVVVAALRSRASDRTWGWGRYGLAVFGVALVLLLVMSIGRIGAELA